MSPNCTHRDASNGGIDISGKRDFDIFSTKHRFQSFDFLVKNHILIKKLLFSWDTERMDITVDSVASKRFGWTNSQPIRMLYRDFLSISVFSQGWSGSESKQARILNFRHDSIDILSVRHDIHSIQSYMVMTIM